MTSMLIKYETREKKISKRKKKKLFIYRLIFIFILFSENIALELFSVAHALEKDEDVIVASLKINQYDFSSWRQKHRLRFAKNLVYLIIINYIITYINIIFIHIYIYL